MRQTYKKYKHRRKAGSRIATVRKLAESMSLQINPNFDLDPFVLEPEASTIIKSSMQKYIKEKRAYRLTILSFYTNLVLFKNALTSFNANLKAIAKSRLLNSIPVGRTLERILKVPNVVPIVTRLRAILSDPYFIFPQHNTQPYFELEQLITALINIISASLQLQRRETAGPSNLAQGRRIKSRRNKLRRS
jgi:hypothetical protein